MFHLKGLRGEKGNPGVVGLPGIPVSMAPFTLNFLKSPVVIYIRTLVCTYDIFYCDCKTTRYNANIWLLAYTDK